MHHEEVVFLTIILLFSTFSSHFCKGLAHTNCFVWYNEQGFSVIMTKSLLSTDQQMVTEHTFLPQLAPSAKATQQSTQLRRPRAASSLKPKYFFSTYPYAPHNTYMVRLPHCPRDSGGPSQSLLSVCCHLAALTLVPLLACLVFHN